MKKTATRAGSGQEVQSDRIVLTPDHKRHLQEELGGARGVEEALKYGARSLTEQEAACQGFRLKGKDGRIQHSSGLLLPFRDNFAQLRCDVPPLNSKGEQAKYLSAAGQKQTIAIFGEGEPRFATEGWKDALALHLHTGEPTAAIAGVHSWRLLPESIELLMYDADARLNPNVWGPLVQAGFERPGLKLAFFPEDIAGSKGGACEFFKAGGQLKDVRAYKAKALLLEIPGFLPKDLRVDWYKATIANLARGGISAGLDRLALEKLLEQAGKKLGVARAHQTAILQNELGSISRKKRQAEEAALQARLGATGEVSPPSKPPEPEETHKRVVELVKHLGATWRADYETTTAWLSWTSTHWVTAGTNDYINRALESAYNDLGWEARDAKTVRDDREGLRRAITTGLPECRSDLVYFRNGALRLSDKRLISHDPSHGNRYCLPFDWEGEEVEPKKTIAFLVDRFGDEGSVMMFFCFLRSLLTGEQAKVIVQLVGQGDTGKSVVAAIPHALVGVENCKSGSLHLLEHPNRPFETYGYRGKRLAIFNEAAGYSGALEKLKALTGRDTISAERKGSVSHVDFQFTGGVLIVGNRAIRVSETSDAIFNRLRTIYLDKPVPAHQQKIMLERDGERGWKGELASELPAIAAYALKVTKEQQRHYLSRDLASLYRAQSDLRTLLESDYLAAWANERLVWDEAACSQVGDLRHDPENRNIGWLLPDYHLWVRNTEPNARPYGIQAFKPKLVSLLRDSMRLPLPPDGSNEYRKREAGSVVPCIRLRQMTDPPELRGVVEYGLLKRIGIEPERFRNDQYPVGNGWNGSEGLAQTIREQHHAIPDVQDSCCVSKQGLDAETIPVVPSIPQKGSQRFTSVPEAGVSVPQLVQPQLMRFESAVVGSGADAFADADDPAWGPRPEVA